MSPRKIQVGIAAAAVVAASFGAWTLIGTKKPDTSGSVPPPPAATSATDVRGPVRNDGAHNGADVPVSALDAKGLATYRERISKDPKGAWLEAMKQATPELRLQFVSIWLRYATSKEIAEALRTPLPDSKPDYINCQLFLLKSLGEKDPHLALSVANEAFKDGGRSQAVAAVLCQLYASDPKMVIAELAKPENLALREGVQEILLVIATQNDPHGSQAWAILDAIGPQESLRALAQKPEVAVALAAADPAKLTALLESLPATNPNSNAIRSVLEKISGKNPRLALELMVKGQLPLGTEDMGKAMDRAVVNFLMSDKKAGMAYLQDSLATASGSTRTELAKQVGRSLVAIRDPQELAKTFAAMDEQDKAKAAAGYFGILGATSMMAPIAKDLVTKNDPMFTALPPDEQAKAVGTGALSISDPIEAQKWVDSLGREDLQTAGYTALVKSWVGRDPVAAGNWVGSLKNGPTKDAVIETFASQIDQADPQLAAQWRAQIGK